MQIWKSTKLLSALLCYMYWITKSLPVKKKMPILKVFVTFNASPKSRLAFKNQQFTRNKTVFKLCASLDLYYSQPNVMIFISFNLHWPQKQSKPEIETLEMLAVWKHTIWTVPKWMKIMRLPKRTLLQTNRASFKYCIRLTLGRQQAYSSIQSKNDLKHLSETCKIQHPFKYVRTSYV